MVSQVEGKKCNYPDCLNCEHDSCFRDRQKSLVLPQKRADRKAYHKKYYEEHKEARKAKYEQNLVYIKLSDAKKIIVRLKPLIGKANVEIIKAAFEEYEKNT